MDLSLIHIFPVAGHPTTIVFLTADANGVLPPIARPVSYTHLHSVSGNQIVFVGGGVSGLSQNLVKLIHDIIGWQKVNPRVLQSILYFTLNIPVFILGWLKIGRRFTIFSIINVLLASLFISIIPVSLEKAVIYDSQLTRTLYAGILAGFSAAVAFSGNVSSGGMDIIAYYLSLIHIF